METVAQQNQREQQEREQASRATALATKEQNTRQLKQAADKIHNEFAVVADAHRLIGFRLTDLAREEATLIDTIKRAEITAGQLALELADVQSLPDREGRELAGKIETLESELRSGELSPADAKIAIKKLAEERAYQANYWPSRQETLRGLAAEFPSRLAGTESELQRLRERFAVVQAELRELQPKLEPFQKQMGEIHMRWMRADGIYRDSLAP